MWYLVFPFPRKLASEEPSGLLNVLLHETMGRTLIEPRAAVLSSSLALDLLYM
jgi:hypothetical protein